MKVLSEGTSNFILEPPPQITIDAGDERAYPPQLKDLPRDSYVFRVTKMVQECLRNYEDCECEIRLSLDAAFRGFGPQVYAAVIVPFEYKGVPHCATVFAIERYHTNLQHVHQHIWPGQKSSRQIKGSEEEVLKIKSSVDKIANGLWLNFVRMSRAGMVHFDLKCLNIVVKHNFESAVIDFESSLCKMVKIKRESSRPGESMGQWRGVLAVNALLLLTHVRAFTPVWFAEQLVAAMRNNLISTITTVSEKYMENPTLVGGDWFLKAEFVDDSNKEHIYKHYPGNDAHSLEALFIGVHNYYFRRTKDFTIWTEKASEIHDSILSDIQQNKRAGDIYYKQQYYQKQVAKKLPDILHPRAENLANIIVSSAFEWARLDAENVPVRDQLSKSLSDAIMDISRPYNAHHPPKMWNVKTYGIPAGGMMSQLLRFVVLWERNQEHTASSSRLVTTDKDLCKALGLLDKIGTRRLYGTHNLSLIHI